MRLVYYFRSDDPAVIEAKAKDHERALKVQAAGEAFAARFPGAVPAYIPGFAPLFAGVQFKGQPENPKFWSKPRKDFPCVVPKAHNVPPSQKAAFHALVQEWNDNLPKEYMEPAESHVLTKMGFHSSMLQGNAMQFFIYKDVSYVATTFPISPETGFVEILASDFDKARRLWQIEQAREEHQQAQAANEEN